MSKRIAKISDIRPDPQNANKGTARGRLLLERSLRQLGAGRSILVDKNGVAIAGNKTLDVAAELQLNVREIETDGNTLIVVKRTDLDLANDPRAKELAIADNRVSEIGLEWDGEALQAQGIDLAPWFTEGEQLALKSPEAEAVDLDKSENNDEDPLIQIKLQAHASKITSKFLDELHKFCGKHGVKVLDDDESRPNRRYWGSWRPGPSHKA